VSGAVKVARHGVVSTTTTEDRVTRQVVVVSASVVKVNCGTALLAGLGGAVTTGTAGSAVSSR
jgi:hypothetical protein